ncbi:hypothetical protein ADUPG1_007176, partial [Aduncisulcus paluster]
TASSSSFEGIIDELIVKSCVCLEKSMKLVGKVKEKKKKEIIAQKEEKEKEIIRIPPDSSLCHCIPAFVSLEAALSHKVKYILRSILKPPKYHTLSEFSDDLKSGQEKCPSKFLDDIWRNFMASFPGTHSCCLSLLSNKKVIGNLPMFLNGILKIGIQLKDKNILFLIEDLISTVLVQQMNIKSPIQCELLCLACALSLGELFKHQFPSLVADWKRLWSAFIQIATLSLHFRNIFEQKE